LKSKLNAWTVGLAAGQLEGAPLRFAAELARVLDDGDNMRVLPIVTRGPSDNVVDLLYLRGVDAAIVYGDVLDHFQRERKITGLERRISYIMPLFPSEVHVFVRPEIGKLEGCTLFDIDDLGDGLVGREEDVREAEEIVAQEAARFAEWRRSRGAAGAIRALRDRAETIRSEELARAEPRLAELSPRERKTVETLTSQIVNKLLHAPTVRAKEAGSEPLRDLFALRDDGE
jgi:hypothetical protein